MSLVGVLRQACPIAEQGALVERDLCLLLPSSKAGPQLARKSRYIGSAKARLQAAWAAALVNLNPIRHRLMSQSA